MFLKLLIHSYHEITMSNTNDYHLLVFGRSYFYTNQFLSYQRKYEVFDFSETCVHGLLGLLICRKAVSTSCH